MRSAGFPPSYIHSRNFVVKKKKKKPSKFNTNDQEPLARLGHGKTSH